MTIPFSALLILILSGVPLGIAFALVVLIAPGIFNINLGALSSVPYESISSFPLVAIPLFLLVGEAMSRGGLAKRLTDFCDRALLSLPARMGHIAIAACGLMGAITGSSVATVAAIGSIVGPEMDRRGYTKEYGASLIASAGLLGVLLPPSIPLIIYGAAVGVSITDLFLATIIPGILVASGFFIIHAIRSKRSLRSGQEEATAPSENMPHTSLRGSRRTASALFLPILVLGGIYAGVFTPTEAAAVAATYTLLVIITQRSMGLSELKETFISTAIIAASILTIIALSSIFNRALVLNSVPQELANLILSLTDSPMVFLLGVNIVLFAVGMFVDTNTAVFLLGPLLAPAAMKYGIDPVHFGIIVVVNIETGLITPPLAVNIFVAARTFSANVFRMIPHILWFLLVCVIVLLMITYIPFLTLWFRYL